MVLTEGSPDKQELEGRLVEILHRISGANPAAITPDARLMEAKVCDLSLARDFNQITEILMAADLSRLPEDRLAFFIDVDHQPVYQQFSWYRGEG